MEQSSIPGMVDRSSGANARKAPSQLPQRARTPKTLCETQADPIQESGGSNLELLEQSSIHGLFTLC